MKTHRLRRERVAHVAGAAALFLEARPGAEPATVSNALLGGATVDALSGVTGLTRSR